MVFDYLRGIIFFGLISLILLLIARAKGFFVLPSLKDAQKPQVTASILFIVFGIYIGMTMLIAPIIAKTTSAIYSIFSEQSLPLAALGWIQLFILLGIFLLFYLFFKARDRELFKKIWKNRSIPHPKEIPVDCFMGVLTWIISFPLVLVVGQCADLVLYLLFGYENYEQVAVRYLKTTLSSPPMLIIALFTILVAAPIIEEFLFRGCLQNFFKKHFSVKRAILLTSLCFSLFHFAPSQGLGNISLVISLFLFALFLGFIYERQASLFASVSLHMTFNAVSTFRILFFPD